MYSKKQTDATTGKLVAIANSSHQTDTEIPAIKREMTEQRSLTQTTSHNCTQNEEHQRHLNSNEKYTAITSRSHKHILVWVSHSRVRKMQTRKKVYLLWIQLLSSLQPPDVAACEWTSQPYIFCCCCGIINNWIKAYELIQGNSVGFLV